MRRRPEAIEPNPRDLNAHDIRGVLYRLGQVRPRHLDLDMAIGLNPSDPDAYNIRGLCHGKKGEKAKAAYDYMKAREFIKKP